MLKLKKTKKIKNPVNPEFSTQKKYSSKVKEKQVFAQINKNQENSLPVISFYKEC